MSGYPVEAPSERSATLTQTYIADLTTTRQRISFPSGARWVHVIFDDVGTTAVNGQFCKMVFGTVTNPVTEAQANGILTTTGCVALALDRSLTFSFTDGAEALTLDVIAAAAVGSGKTVLTVMWGV